MKGHGAKLGRKQEAAIAALLTAGTIAEAAQACGISAATLWRWQQQPEFAERFRIAREDVLKGTTTLLRNAASQAVATLQSVAGDAGQLAGARVTAAKAILEFAFRADENEKLKAAPASEKEAVDREALIAKIMGQEPSPAQPIALRTVREQ
jgi:transposase-like protein